MSEPMNRPRHPADRWLLAAVATLAASTLILALILITTTPARPTTTATATDSGWAVAREVLHASRATTRPALPAASPATPATPSVVDWLRLIRCESLGDGSWAPWSTSTARGFFQFEPATWASVGGRGDPAAASIAEQYGRALALWRRDGWAPWVCARIVGLR